MQCKARQRQYIIIIGGDDDDGECIQQQGQGREAIEKDYA
jgi:hypothetical protein